MASLNIAVILLGLGIVLLVNGSPVEVSSANLNGIQGDSDQLTSGTVANPVVPDSVAAATSSKSDLKTSDSFGLGYYLPVVAPLAVKYHYPLLYYHPTAYLHSLRHHGYGGYGFHHHGYGLVH